MTAKTVIPSTQEELEEALNDPKRVEELMGEPDKLREFIGDYAKAVLERDSGLKTQLTEAVIEGNRAFLEKQQKKDGAKPIRRLPVDPSVVNGSSGGRVSQIYEPLGLTKRQAMQIAATGSGPGVELAGQWETLGKWLADTSLLRIRNDGVPDAYKLGVQKDLLEGAGADGGFLVPEEFRAELLMLALEAAVVRSRARVIPMASSSVRFPAIRDASHATNVFGGVSGTWVGEGGDTSSATNQPTFMQILLTARKLTGYTVASNELLADSAISLEALINSLFADALAYFEDDAFINGTGAGQPLGILNADALIAVAKETGQAATTIVYENIVKMYSRMLPQSIGRAVWIAHPDTFPELAKMALSVGTGGSAVWISNVAGGPPATIFGRPLILTEKAQTLGTAGDIYFVDLGFYLIGDRQSLTVASSMHQNFNTDEMVWRFVQRVDGRPWITTALTPRNGSNTLSPFVDLATRA